jgi:hypothetical protein
MLLYKHSIINLIVLIKINGINYLNFWNMILNKMIYKKNNKKKNNKKIKKILRLIQQKINNK